MKFFYDEMNREDVWRKAHGAEEIVVRSRRTSRTWTSGDRSAPTSSRRTRCTSRSSSEAMGDPPRYKRWLAKLGYREPLHRALVQRTFQRHAESRMGDPAYHEAIGRAADARDERAHEVMAEEQGGPGGILNPIEGCTILLCGQIYSQAGQRQAGRVHAVLGDALDGPARSGSACPRRGSTA